MLTIWCNETHGDADMLTIWCNETQGDADMLTIKTGPRTGSCSGPNLGKTHMLNEGVNVQQSEGALLLRLLVLVSSPGDEVSASECNSSKSESWSSPRQQLVLLYHSSMHTD